MWEKYFKYYLPYLLTIFLFSFVVEQIKRISWKDTVKESLAHFNWEIFVRDKAFQSCMKLTKQF